ncbi:MAG: hypothetical protein M1609_15700 [Firmicutes bacterium]|nr:hypothetical protein [Bacillota bacterium]
MAAWCSEHSVKEHQFYYWRKKLRFDQAEKEQPVKWLPMEIDICKQARRATGSISET